VVVGVADVVGCTTVGAANITGRAAEGPSTWTWGGLRRNPECGVLSGQVSMVCSASGGATSVRVWSLIVAFRLLLAWGLAGRSAGVDSDSLGV
jgi:hypothetical protein